MSLQIRIDTVLINQRVRLTGSQFGGITGFPTAAYYGEVGRAGYEVDDPFGELDIGGWHTTTATETLADPQRLFSGWMFSRQIQRGEYRTGPGRVWACEVIDLNALFSFEVFRANSAQRPEETDLARIAFALGSAPMAGTPIVDNGRVTSTPSNVLAATDFVREFPLALWTSCAGQTGNNFFAYWDPGASEISASYEPMSAWPVSDLSISNVRADVDNTAVFYPLKDATLDRNPDSVYTGILLDYLGGSVYGRLQSTIDALSPSEFSPINFLRDDVIRSDRIGKVTTANNFLQTYLAGAALEADTITVSVRLPAALANGIMPGMLLPVKFQHLPGYEDFVTLPVIRRHILPTAGRRDMYDLQLELTGKQKVTVGGGPPGVFPHRQACDVADVAVVQSAHGQGAIGSTAFSLKGPSWASPPTAGNLLIMLWSSASPADTEPGDFPGWLEIQTGLTMNGVGGAGTGITTYYRVADGTEVTQPESDVNTCNYGGGSKANANGYLVEVSGVDSLDGFVTKVQPGSQPDYIGTPISPTPGNVAFLIGFFGVNQGPGFAFPIAEDAGVTQLYEEGCISGGTNPGRWLGWMKVAHTTGSYNVGGTENIPGATFDWAYVGIAFTCSGGSDCPAPGQWVYAEVPTPAVDGTTTTFTTKCPFADGSLIVHVDHTIQTAAVTAQDGAAGTFTIPAPHVGMLLEVDYQGRNGA